MATKRERVCVCERERVREREREKEREVERASAELCTFRFGLLYPDWCARGCSGRGWGLDRYPNCTVWGRVPCNLQYLNRHTGGVLHSFLYTTGCSLNIVFFKEFSKVCHLSLASTRLLLVVQKITSFEGLLQRCRRERGCSEL